MHTSFLVLGRAPLPGSAASGGTWSSPENPVGSLSKATESRCPGAVPILSPKPRTNQDSCLAFRQQASPFPKPSSPVTHQLPNKASKSGSGKRSAALVRQRGLGRAGSAAEGPGPPLTSRAVLHVRAGGVGLGSASQTAADPHHRPFAQPLASVCGMNPGVWVNVSLPLSFSFGSEQPPFGLRPV